MKAAAAQRGRKLSFGIRLHVIVRETNAEAWTAADELIQHVTDETVASAQKIFSPLSLRVPGDGNVPDKAGP